MAHGRLASRGDRGMIGRHRLSATYRRLVGHLTMLSAIGQWRDRPMDKHLVAERTHHAAAVRRLPPGASPLGDWIKTRREVESLSQRALADRAGISRSYLCDIERGRGTRPSVASL